jgi:hypothetical protein
MKRVIFYSWQSDLPNFSNRGFIGDALADAAAGIHADETIAVEPVVDRDTQGVPGAPDIASTIFAKITGAGIFVADVSIVVRNENRATPNPNVLIELGYAFKALGPERVILVFNRAFGKIEELPFDLRMRRVLSYEMANSGAPKAPERKTLEKQLDGAIRMALEHQSADQTAPAIPSVVALENQAPNRLIVLRKDLEGILGKLDDLQPTRYREGGTVDDLLKGIDATQKAAAEFSKIVETISMMSDGEGTIETLRWFGNVFERYDKPKGFGGKFFDSDEDYSKFLGHELFVTFIAALLREERWNLIGDVLSRGISMKYVAREYGPGVVGWQYASEHTSSISAESSRRHRVCFRADMLKERHTTGRLAGVMPLEDFMAADYLLYLFGEMSQDKWGGGFFTWNPWSTLFLQRIPPFLQNAERKQEAEKLVRLFKLPSIEEFRKRLAERAPRLGQLFRGGFPWENPFKEEDAVRLGTI